MPVPSIPLDVVAGAVSSQLISGRVVLTGVMLRETTGVAPAVVRLHDGQSNTGLSLIPVTLAANESVRDWWQPGGVLYTRGVFAEIVSGTAEGIITCIPEDLVGPQAFAAVIQGYYERGEHVG